MRRVVVLFLFLVLLGCSSGFQNVVFAQGLNGLLGGGGWLGQLRLGEAKVGLYYGSGNLTVTHKIKDGPVNFGWRRFAGFEHCRKTDLTDLYLSFQCSLIARGVEILDFKIDTNVGRRLEWEQTTAAGVGDS